MKFPTFLTILLFAHFCDSKISEENEQLIRTYMPIFWLHSEEVFNPTNFDYYISHMQLQDADGNIIDANPTAETLLIGPESQALHLNTITDVNCVHCYDEALFGMPIDQLKPYAIAKEWGDECNTIDVRFGTWYPYNYGKDVCLSVDPFGFCLGARVTFGNHFCDGDTSYMRIQNGRPKLLQLNVHTMGALYKYDEETNTFKFLSGEDLEISDGVTRPVTYPDTVNMDTSHFTHPEIFVSNGSHGMWAQPGKHNYLQLVIHLDDYTDRGTLWPFYEQATIIDYADAASDDVDALPADLRFRKFQGRFGNTNEIGCEVTEPLFGVCQVSGCGGQPFGGSPTYGAFPNPPQC